MTVYVDVTYVLCVAFQSGIPRVVREVLLRLLRKSHPPLTPIYYDAGSGEHRLVNPDKLLLALELGIRQLEGLIAEPAFSTDRILKGDVFLDIDAVWHLSQDRGVLYPRLKAAGARIISYVYDVIPVSDPQSCNIDATRKFLSYLGAVLGHADLILAPTQSTLDEIGRICDERSMPRIPSQFTWLGSDFTESLANKCHLRTVHPDAVGACRAGRYVLMVGTIQPLKNQGLVLDAFDQTLFAKGVNLVLAGRIGWDVDALEKRIREHPLLGRRLFFLEGMDDATIDYLYRNAFCLAFATRREGFGLPTVEALQRGVPVLASDIPVLHEVGGDFCRYFNPDSATSFVEAIEPLLESSDEYNALRAKVATYRPVTWDLVSGKIASIAGGMLPISRVGRFICKARFTMRKAVKRLFADSTPASAFAVRGDRWLSFAQSDGAPALVHVVDGISHPEQDFTWTCGSELVLAFKSKKGGKLSLSLRCRTFLPEERIVVRAGDREVASVRVAGEEVATFMIPCESHPPNGIFIVRLDLPDAISPAEVLGTADTRRIALALFSLRGKWV